MKRVKIDIQDELIVSAVKVIDVPADPDEEEGFNVPTELDMEINFGLRPDTEYLVEISDEADGKVTLTLENGIVIPDFPKDKLLEAPHG